MKSIACSLFVLLLGILFTSCSSTGSGRLASSAIAQSSKSVFLRPNSNERATEFMPELTSELRAAGFTVTSSNAAPYEVAMTLAGGGFDLTCSIVMYERGVPVVSGKGVNPGWGVWLARNSAYRGVFSSALRQFSQRIQSM